MSQLENVMADAIKDAHGSIGQATNFVLEQMPDLIQQAMLWYAVSSFFIMCFCIWYCVAFFRYVKNFDFNILNEDEAKGILSVLHLIIGSVAFVFAFFCIFLNFDWLQIIIAPKLWLVEFAAQLTK